MLLIMGQKYSSIKPQKPLCGTSPGLLSPHCVVQETLSVGWETVPTPERSQGELLTVQNNNLCRQQAKVTTGLS